MLGDISLKINEDNQRTILLEYNEALNEINEVFHMEWTLKIDEMNNDTIIFIDNCDKASLDNIMALLQLAKDLVVIDPCE